MVVGGRGACRLAGGHCHHAASDSRGMGLGVALWSATRCTAKREAARQHRAGGHLWHGCAGPYDRLDHLFFSYQPNRWWWRHHLPEQPRCPFLWTRWSRQGWRVVAARRWGRRP